MKVLDALLDGLIDYAGLFPPASQNMRDAVESYATYRSGPDRAALGRFVVPLTRLAAFELAASALLPRGENAEPWRLSVLVDGDPRAAGEAMPRFNCHHWSASPDGHALIDVVELKANTAADITNQHEALPAFFQRYYEIPLRDNVDDLVTTIASVGGRAKARTGGTTKDAFPAAADLCFFLFACHRNRVAFKATAGLHHPVRGAYPLTYERDGESGRMYGFLNLFLAAALVDSGENEAVVLRVLEESDPSAFAFTEDSITWSGHVIDVSELRRARQSFAVSFGSCSFREPVDELKYLVSTLASTE